MRRPLLMLLLALALCACSQPAPPASSVAPTSAPTAAPTNAPTIEPTAAPAIEPTAPLAPTAAPTSAPTSAPIDAPTAAPAIAPTSLPAPPDALAPLNPQDQAPALLADFRGDLDRAGEWNRYTIGATIDPQQRTLGGSERLDYTNRDSRPLDALYFHLYPNLPDFHGRISISALAVDGRAAPVVYELRNYLLRVNLPQPLAPGASATVTLNFAVTAPKNVSDTFYGAFNEENGVLALASSYPIVAIVRNGVWDIGWPDSQGDFVNSETSLYDVTLTAPADWQLATTGVAVSQQNDGALQTLRIVSGPQRDFMIAANQLAHADTVVEGTHITSYYLPADADGGRIALETAANALRTYNVRYGRYPLAEVDIVEVAARTFLGVEYPGLIMIERRLYSRPDPLEVTVAHEMGHQWWYSQVGNDVQTEAWLDEALASYSQIVYEETVHGGDAGEAQLDDFRQRYRAIREGRLDAPVELPTAAFHGNYVGIVYGKAVLFFQALRDQMGEAAFDHFLHDYYSSHRYGFVTGADLLASAEGSCGCDLHQLYQDWIMSLAPVEIP